jgi:hypothetical protein
MEDTDESRFGDYLYIIYPNELETKNITHNHMTSAYIWFSSCSWQRITIISLSQ